ncbi:IS630 family transposase [Myxococcota bacterium]|nr:IS630 family transposase [Myxococcota bacterium]
MNYDITEADRPLLESILRRSSEEFRILRRAGIVLNYLDCGSISQTASACECERKTVRTWVRRWASNRSIEALRDLQRNGRKPVFGLDTTAKVLSLVSHETSAYGLVTATWTQALVVEVMASQGVELSRSTVQRILARQDIDVRSVKYWLFTPTDRENFIERRNAICALYGKMYTLPDDEIVVCFDAKPGIQILGDPKNKGGKSAPRAGQFRRIEFEYRRMGTRGLVAAVSPISGEVLHHDLFHKERRFDSAATIAFLDELRQALAAQGFRRIHLVLDNGSTHVSKATTAYFAEHTEFFTTYFTPVHASWLNLCENFFSNFSRRYLRHRRYESVADFTDGMPLWVEDHNQRCNPLRWTYAPHQEAA